MPKTCTQFRHVCLPSLHAHSFGKYCTFRLVPKYSADYHFTLSYWEFHPLPFHCYSSPQINCNHSIDSNDVLLPSETTLDTSVRSWFDCFDLFNRSLAEVSENCISVILLPCAKCYFRCGTQTRLRAKTTSRQFTATSISIVNTEMLPLCLSIGTSVRVSRDIVRMEIHHRQLSTRWNLRMFSQPTFHLRSTHSSERNNVKLLTYVHRLNSSNYHDGAAWVKRRIRLQRNN